MAGCALSWSVLTNAVTAWRRSGASPSSPSSTASRSTLWCPTAPGPALRNAPPEAERLATFVASIQRQRNDFGSPVLTIRSEDISLAALLYEIPPAELREKLVAWGVLAASSA